MSAIHVSLAFILTVMPCISTSYNTAYTQERTNVNASLESAWLRLLECDRNEANAAVALGELRVQRFLGFVEGKCDCDIPEWWSHILSSAVLHENGRLVTSPPRSISFKKTDLEFDIAFADTIMVRDEYARVQNNGLERKVRVGLLKRPFEKEAAQRVAVCNAKSATLAAVYSSLGGYPYRMVCIDADGESILWQRQIVASDAKETSGRGYHIVEIKTIDDNVIVFGAESNSLYIEIFRLTDGTDVARFCTSLVAQ